MGAAGAVQIIGAAYQVGTDIGNAIAARKGRPKGPGRPGNLSKNRQLFNQSTQNILEMEQSMLANAASQGNVVNDEIYRTLGYEPQYSNDAPDPTALKANSDQAYSATVTAYTDWQKAKKTFERAKSAAGNSRPKARAAADAARELKLANDRLSMARTTYASQRDAYQSALINPRQIIGLKPIELPTEVGPGTSNDDMMRIAQHLGNEGLIRALKGEEPIDATLTHAFETGEDNLRERLRRQLGPDYETSTAGSQALANFDREKGEAFQQYNRESINLFANLANKEAIDLDNITGARINQLLVPGDNILQMANALGNSADSRTRYIQAQRQNLLNRAGYNVDAYNAGSAGQQAATQARQLQIAANNQLANTISGAAIAGGDSLGRYLGQQSNNSAWQSADIGSQPGDYGRTNV